MSSDFSMLVALYARGWNVSLGNHGGHVDDGVKIEEFLPAVIICEHAGLQGSSHAWRFWQCPNVRKPFKKAGTLLTI